MSEVNSYIFSRVQQLAACMAFGGLLASSLVGPAAGAAQNYNSRSTSTSTNTNSNTINTNNVSSNDCLRESTANAKITFSGNRATADFKLPGNCKNQTVSLVSYQAPNGTDGKPYAAQKLFDSTTREFNVAGNHRTISVNVPDCFFQIDLVKGQPKQSFADGSTYHAEHRFLAGRMGGNKSCDQQQPTAVTPAVAKSVSCKAIEATKITPDGTLPSEFQFITIPSVQNATVANYRYDFGDGSTQQSSTNTIRHSYSQAGTYKVTVTLSSPDTPTTTTTTSTTNTINMASTGTGTLTCSTSVTVSPARTATPAAVTTTQAPPPAKALPQTGPAETIAAFGFGSTFMGSLLFAYRRKFADYLATILN